MIKEFINIELNNLPIEGLDIHIIKKYEITTSGAESFLVENLSILLIRSGSFKIKLHDIVQDLTSHDLLVLPKNSYCTLLEARDKLQLYLVSLSSEFTVKNCFKKELVDSLYFFIRKRSFKITLEEREYQMLSLIYKLIYFVNRDAVRNGFDAELQRISLNLFLYELREIYIKYSPKDEVPFNRKETLAIQFLTMLSIHGRKQHYVQFYAGSLYVTPAYLNFLVKQFTGKNVKYLITENLILEAKILLEDTQLTIADIVDELEFTSMSAFSFFFRKHTALSPSEYRSKFVERFKSQ
ncbi:AraC family transcriptional regulator [Flavobacterium psychroterrae]|uniref:AraC family transcriptional regulator n=1 Tax=Flavobacterium psychroterrae TaxID=2133767 RepID=A0ABS5PA34_9FLAO|nr:helix-turn-helix domain-containing protein [Flavobacterium psychroterrae]MBS7230971.1 AraC family transcriptional regulator [Flavobacterium psychroterrae]